MSHQPSVKNVVCAFPMSTHFPQKWYYRRYFIICFCYLTIHCDIFYTVLTVHLLWHHINGVYSAPFYVHPIIYLTLVVHTQRSEKIRGSSPMGRGQSEKDKNGCVSAGWKECQAGYDTGGGEPGVACAGGVGFEQRVKWLSPGQGQGRRCSRQREPPVQRSCGRG